MNSLQIVLHFKSSIFFQDSFICEKKEKKKNGKLYAKKHPRALFHWKIKRVEEILALNIHERHIGYKSTAGATAKRKTLSWLIKGG